jgi:EmrB/QacA subfamily drug resistance transporter
LAFPLSRSAAIALLVAGAFFMENLDGTVVVTAMPQMAASFRVHPVDLSSGVSAYMLTLAVLIPASGWVADRFGARRVFAGAIILFTLASALCALCTSLPEFVLARILQGCGGAMMVPVGRLTVLRSTEKQNLINAIATITWPGLAAPMLGPPLGGFITTYASWHWIFLLNLPLGILALPLALVLIPGAKTVTGKPFDRLGFLLSGLACLVFMYGLEMFSHQGASWTAACFCVLLGLGIALLAIRHARRQEHPLIDYGALAYRSYATTIWGGSLFRGAIAAMPFLLPLLFQLGFGLTPFASGMLVLAVFTGNLVMKPFTTPILRRFRFRFLLLVNGTLNAAAIFACALLTPATPVPVILALLFVTGLTRSMQFTALNTLAFAEVPAAKMSGANTLFNMAQQMAMGTGIALGAVALRVAILVHPDRHGVPLEAFHIAFILTGMIALAGLFDVLALSPQAGDAIRLKQPG